MALLDELTNIGNRILIAGAHPDDAEFSTGKLLLRRKGKNSFIVCVSDGRKGQDASEKKISEDVFAAIRQNESINALKDLGLGSKNIFYLGLPDQEVISNPYIIDRLYILIKKVKPDFIFIPPWEGSHPDHDAVHLFFLIALKNIKFNLDNVIEYGSYNNFQGNLHVQEFIPQINVKEVKLFPTKGEMENWLKAMKNFKTQKSLQELYIPKSSYESFRCLPTYNYSRLPYSTVQANLIRSLLIQAYPIARKLIPNKDKLYYETWKDNINPEKVKEKLNEYIIHYGTNR